MDFSPIIIRAADKEAAKEALNMAFDEYPCPHVPDWELAYDCACLMIDALQDNPKLDVVASVHGMLMFEGDMVRHVRLSFDAVLADRT